MKEEIDNVRLIIKLSKFKVISNKDKVTIIAIGEGGFFDKIPYCWECLEQSCSFTM